MNFKRALIVALAGATVTAAFMVGVASSNDGTASVARSVRGASMKHNLAVKRQYLHGAAVKTGTFKTDARRGRRGPPGPQGPQGPQGAAGAQGRQGTGTLFFRGAGSTNSIDTTTPVQEIELFCPAGYTAIAGGVTSNDGLVLLNEATFDSGNPGGVFIGVTYLGNGSAAWVGVGTCEA